MMRGFLLALCLLWAGAVAAQEAAVAGLAPGSHGEPFGVDGLMQGCAEPETNGCLFYAKGARWAVTRGAGGNEAAIDAKAALPMPARGARRLVR